jgi:hypothetical protein
MERVTALAKRLSTVLATAGRRTFAYHFDPRIQKAIGNTTCSR